MFGQRIVWNKSGRLRLIFFVVSLLGAVGAHAQSSSMLLNNDASGHWMFNDCSTTTTVLRDSSKNDAPASRSAGVTCGPGADGPVGGRGVVFRQSADGTYPIVTVTKTSGFAITKSTNGFVDSDITVAAWVNPTVTTQGTIVTKALTASGNAFTLDLYQDRPRFTVWVRPTSGTTPVAVRITAPHIVPRNFWTHVAGSLSGGTLKLYFNGTEVNSFLESRPVADGPGTIRMSSSSSAFAFTGTLDEVWVSTKFFLQDMADIACVRRAPSYSVFSDPPINGPVAPGTQIFYYITVKNNDFGPNDNWHERGALCEPRELELRGLSTAIGYSAWAKPAGEPVEQFTFDPQQSYTFFNVARSTAEVDSGQQSLWFGINQIRTLQLPAVLATGKVSYPVQARTASCSIQTGREILITDPSVVEDPVRTTGNGAWTFKTLITNIAAVGADVPTLMENLIKTWNTPQSVGGFTVESRPDTAATLLGAWPRTADGKLDLDRAPFRLTAIVSRLDKRDVINADVSKRSAGEGRFAFTFLAPGDEPEDDRAFNLILEYRLPATDMTGVMQWANRWHALGALPFPSATYNTRLQEVTDLFAGRGRGGSGRVNGSALNQLRTNDYLNIFIGTGIEWEMREFRLSSTTGFLRLVPVEQTPDSRYQNNSSLLAAYINQNKVSILRETHVVPTTFNGTALAGGSSINQQNTWIVSGITSSGLPSGATVSDVRHKFALNTCNGCHSPETGSKFAQLVSRHKGTPSELSPFLTGTRVTDPVDPSRIRLLNDLKCRTNDLARLVCGAASLPAQYNCRAPIQ